MRRFTLSLPLALACALTACQTEEQQQDLVEETDQGAIEQVAADLPDPDTRVQFQPLGNSGVTGAAVLSPAGSLTRISVELTGAPGAGTHQGHIHQGTCASPGGVVTPLTPVDTNVEGESSVVGSSVQMPARDLLDGEHIILYHAQGGDPGPPIACAQLPEAETPEI